MTKTEAAGSDSLRRAALALVLLIATAALAGVQALAPAPARAAIDLGEECADPTFSSIDCESTGGGTGGGGTVGSGESGGGEVIVGDETIIVESNAPSPCAVRPQSCLPSQPGGGQRFGRDGGGSQRAPRPRGRLRVAEGPKAKGKVKVPTKEECTKLQSTAPAVPPDVLQALETQTDEVVARYKAANAKWWGFQRQQVRIAAEVARLREAHRGGADVEAEEETLAMVQGKMESLAHTTDLLENRLLELSKEKRHLKTQAAIEQGALLAQCRARYPDPA